MPDMRSKTFTCFLLAAAMVFASSAEAACSLSCGAMFSASHCADSAAAAHVPAIASADAHTHCGEVSESQGPSVRSKDSLGMAQRSRPQQCGLPKIDVFFSYSSHSDVKLHTDAVQLFSEYGLDHGFANRIVRPVLVEPHSPPLSLRI